MKSLETADGQSPARRFAAQWQFPKSVPDIFEFLAAQSEISADEAAEICKFDLANRWQASIEYPVERYFQKIPLISACMRLKLTLIHEEFLLYQKRGLNPSIDAFAARFPELAQALRVQLLANANKTSDRQRETPSKPVIETHLDLAGEDRKNRIGVDDPTDSFLDNPAQSSPESVGRYRVLRVLGDGGFGRVYLAHDGVLDRNVAVKIPHRHLISLAADVESYLIEARIVSSLDHQNIVPVYDCGHTEDGLCYLVSKFIDGSDLATKVKRAPYTNSAAAELVATVAEALHYAHINRVVHRDVKPANILIDSQGRPYLADFGIALREEDFGKGYTRIGTIAYMSPEQLRGEGHLVDGRSDVFSLGVVLYELITGKKPFPSNRIEHSSALIEPRPPRQVDDSIPKELERICLKALSYRVVDRYSTAIDMASELRLFLQAGTATQIIPAMTPGLSGQSNNSTSGNGTNNSTLLIVPKGLRSFDRDDAGFFLELLPGPRGRDGLPESVRFWKNRIQATESDSFRVGVIYGPSGCGKSSFLKAGVLPLLSSNIIPIYVESTPMETETRLLKALRKYCPELPFDLGLADTMAALRRQRRLVSGQRVLIVLDQFEQWLHSNPRSDSSELLRAIRQCDGVHLQCIITVRDDFWMAVTHFMNDLEVSLVPGDNLAVVDLFNIRHARKVLTAIGQAYDVLPKNLQEISTEEKAFINKAVEDLAQNNQVIPVQLALFAEMVKDKVWTVETLASIGGAQGVGVTFLEETFNGHTANPHHRLHQRAARAVLQELLSEGASGIKGAMRSQQDLLSVSGYAEKPREFDTLVRILDSELRLITPTDPDGNDSEDARTAASSNVSERFYHLTHDYLVPSLKEWLTRKRKETRRGRAELILTDRAAAWSQSPSNRSLPSLMEWLNILFWAGGRSRRDHRPLLNAAAGYYGSRALTGCLLLTLAIWGFFQRIAQTRAMLLVDKLLSCQPADIPKTMEELEPHRRIANAILRKSIASSTNPPGRDELRAAMGLLPVDSKQASAVYEGMLNATPADFGAIRDILLKSSDQEEIAKRLWEELLDTKNASNSNERQFKAGAALAAFDPPNNEASFAKWKQVTGFLAEQKTVTEFLAGQLVAEIRINLNEFEPWVAALRPARNILFEDLNRIFSNAENPDIDRYAAATVLADFAKDQPTRLADLALRATPGEYPPLIARLKMLGDDAKKTLQSEFDVAPSTGSTDEQNRIAKRRAYAAVALLEFEITQPMVAVLLGQGENPILDSFGEDRLSSVGARPELLHRLLNGASTELRAALLRSLGGMNFDVFSSELRDKLVATAVESLKNDPDSGTHSAAEWALRSWGVHALDLRGRLRKVEMEIATNSPVNARKWYINRHGHTMILFQGPVISKTGSPEEEAGRDKSDERQSTRIINRDFAICSTEVSVEQFRKLIPKFSHTKTDYAPTPDCPASYLTWYRAAEYCNLLSEAEGIPEDQWCYIQKEVRVQTPDTPNGGWLTTFQPKDGYLSRTGYRIPTEAEWEYACRAGSTSPFSWGSDPELSPRYAQTIRNSQGKSRPVGSLCPNRFGLFDMHGNVAEWTHTRYRKLLDISENDVEEEPLNKLDYDQQTHVPKIGTDQNGNPVTIPPDIGLVLRGGMATEAVSYQRSANRMSNKPYEGVSPRIGFRVARTLKWH